MELHLPGYPFHSSIEWFDSSVLGRSDGTKERPLLNMDPSLPYSLIILVDGCFERALQRALQGRQ